MVFVIVFVVDVVRLRMCDGFVFVVDQLVVPLFSAVCNLGVVIEAYMCVVYFLFSRTSFPSSTSAYTSPSPFSHYPPTPPARSPDSIFRESPPSLYLVPACPPEPTSMVAC